MTATSPRPTWPYLKASSPTSGPDRALWAWATSTRCRSSARLNPVVVVESVDTKVRLVNTMDSDHPMHHPFHVHGAGRFLVLARDDTPNTNLVWKDTVLVRAGETVDILLEVTGAGRWMAHCHIAEHHQDGMMFTFRVDPA